MVPPGTLRRRVVKAMAALSMERPRAFRGAETEGTARNRKKHVDAFANASMVADAAEDQGKDALLLAGEGNEKHAIRDGNAVDIAFRAQVCHVVFQWLFAPRQASSQRGCEMPKAARKLCCRTLGSNAWPPAWGAPFEDEGLSGEPQSSKVALPPYTLVENALQSSLLLHDVNVPGRALAALTQTLANECLASLLAGGGISLEKCNAFAKDATEARLASSWSVPTPEALRTLAVFAPLLELGAGAPATWARLLVEVHPNVDVCCYHGEWDAALAGEGVPEEPEHLRKLASASFADPDAQAAAAVLDDASAGGGLRLLRGGPEAARRHRGEGRTLVLMNPDYGGRGTFGLACVQAFDGEHVITVGEWAPNCTYGAYADAAHEDGTSLVDATGSATRPPAHGQSFSAECQAYVEEHFDAVNVIRLPSWPMFCDVLVVWRRNAL